MPVFKGTMVVTALFEAPDEESANTLWNDREAAGVLMDMDFGEMVGTAEKQVVEEIPAAEVQSYLLAVGNDGTFFGAEVDDCASGVCVASFAPNPCPCGKGGT